jgi:hypothetical protein
MFVAFAVVGVEPDPRAGRKLVLAHEIFLRRRTKNASMADQLTSALASNRAWTADGGHEATKKLLDSSFGKFSAISQRTISSRSWPRKASKRFWLTSDPLKQKLFASHCANGTPARVNFWGLEQLELSSTRKVHCFLRLVRRLFASTGQKAAAWARSRQFLRGRGSAGHNFEAGT